MPKIVRLDEINCTAQGGPLKCRYHSKILKQHPQAKQFHSLKDVFLEVDKQFAPALVIPAEHSSSLERAKAALAHGEAAAALEEQLTSAQRHALYSYSDEMGSLPFRIVLNNPDSSPSWNHLTKEQVLQKIQHIDAAISIHSVDVSGMKLWRGAKKLYELAGVKPGDVITYPSYVSTTKDLETALEFTNKTSPVVLEIQVKKAFPMIGYHARSEQEMLLSRGVRFKVLELQENVQVNTTNKNRPQIGNVTLIRLVEV